MKKMGFLSTYEASKVYSYSTAHLRRLLEYDVLQGCRIPISDSRIVWMLREDSLRKYIAINQRKGKKKA